MDGMGEALGKNSSLVPLRSTSELPSRENKLHYEIGTDTKFRTLPELLRFRTSFSLPKDKILFIGPKS